MNGVAVMAVEEASPGYRKRAHSAGMPQTSASNKSRFGFLRKLLKNGGKGGTLTTPRASSAGPVKAVALQGARPLPPPPPPPSHPPSTTHGSTSVTPPWQASSSKSAAGTASSSSQQTNDEAHAMGPQLSNALDPTAVEGEVSRTLGSVLLPGKTPSGRGLRSNSLSSRDGEEGTQGHAFMMDGIAPPATPTSAHTPQDDVHGHAERQGSWKVQGSPPIDGRGVRQRSQRSVNVPHSQPPPPSPPPLPQHIPHPVVHAATPDDDGLSDGASTLNGVLAGDDGGYSSDENESAVPCTSATCVKDRKRLLRVVEDLRTKLEVVEGKNREYDSEVRDLKHQVTMLTGRSPDASNDKNGGSAANHYQNQYTELTRDSGALGRTAPFNMGATQRIQHQRIDPKLIIKEQDIVIEKIVGVGCFGKVWKGTYNGRSVAIKCFYSEDSDVIAEINLMSRVSGKPNVLPLEGVYLSNDTGEEAHVALVTPYMVNGSLYDVLVNLKAPQYRASVTMTLIVRMAMQTANGVRSLHQENVIHRDLACRNILVDEDLNVYVSDFGFSRQKENMTSKGFTNSNMGPVRWEAPESLSRKEYSEKTDAFSFAVCLYEMVTGREPWEGETHASVAFQVIAGNRLPIALNCDPVLAELMQRCWDQDGAKRPNFEYLFRRLQERHTQLQNEEREVSNEKQLVYQLRQGTTFYKLPYLKGQPHKRQFRVSEDLRRLKWCFLPTRKLAQRVRDPGRPAFKSVFLKEVRDIRIGMRTANFQRIESVEKFRGRPAFSIITNDRTLDILCPTAEIMDQWVMGLRFLVERLRSPPRPIPEMDHWSILARLRKGGFLLKFGQIGKPHERYIRLSANMKMIFWTSGENPVKGVHKSVDLSLIREMRMFGHTHPGAAVVAPTLKLLSKGVEDLDLAFSLINHAGQAEINFAAPNAIEHAVWTRGLELVIHYFLAGGPKATSMLPTNLPGADECPYDSHQTYLGLHGVNVPGNVPMAGSGRFMQQQMQASMSTLHQPPMRSPLKSVMGGSGRGDYDGVMLASSSLSSAAGRPPVPPLSHPHAHAHHDLDEISETSQSLPESYGRASPARRSGRGLFGMLASALPKLDVARHQSRTTDRSPSQQLNSSQRGTEADGTHTPFSVSSPLSSPSSLPHTRPHLSYVASHPSLPPPPPPPPTTQQQTTIVTGKFDRGHHARIPPPLPADPPGSGGVGYDVTQEMVRAAAVRAKDGGVGESARANTASTASLGTVSASPSPQEFVLRPQDLYASGAALLGLVEQPSRPAKSMAGAGGGGPLNAGL